MTHYSPDGRFVWDGTAWQPVGPGSAAPQVAPRARRGMPAVLAVVLMVAAGGAAGLGGGAALGAVTATRHGPRQPGAMAAAFPDAKARYLPGVTVAYIAGKWLKGANKWACKPWTDNKPMTGAKKWLYCTTTDSSSYDVGVDIEYDDDTHVTRVAAKCDLGPGTRFCTTLIANTAGEVLAGQSKGLRDQGVKWGTGHADSDTTTVIGGVQFKVELEPHGITALGAAP